MRWFTYTRGTIPIHRFASLFKGLKDCEVDILCLNENEKLIWAWDKEQIIKLGKDILAKLMKDNSHLEFLRNECQQTIGIAKEHMKGIDSLTDKDLMKRYFELFEKSSPAMGYLNADIDAFDIYPAEYLQELLLRRFGDADFFRIYSVLTAPSYVSYLKKEEDMLVEIAETGGDDIIPVHERYWWTSLGWENMKPKSREDFKKELNRIRKEGNKPFPLPDKSGLISRLDDKEKRLLELFDIYSELHDLRKEMQVKTTYASYLYLKEIAKRRDALVDDLEWLWPEEIKEFFEGEDRSELIEQRKDSCLILFEGGNLKVLSGDVSRGRAKEELAFDMEDKNVLEGTSASLSKVKGRAKVCSGAKEAMEKVTSGDILVCGMTLPDYLPAMKRAAAIVTDEGGITCHAALISREFSIPCVVGTMDATRIIKDDDMLEVDANNGVVRRID